MLGPFCFPGAARYASLVAGGREVTMPTFGVWEWIIILVIFVIFFGAGKLGDLGGALRRSITNFKQTAGIGEGDKNKDDNKPLQR